MTLTIEQKTAALDTLEGAELDPAELGRLAGIAASTKDFHVRLDGALAARFEQKEAIQIDLKGYPEKLLPEARRYLANAGVTPNVYLEYARTDMFPNGLRIGAAGYMNVHDIAGIVQCHDNGISPELLRIFTRFHLDDRSTTLEKGSHYEHPDLNGVINTIHQFKATLGVELLKVCITRAGSEPRACHMPSLAQLTEFVSKGGSVELMERYPTAWRAITVGQLFIADVSPELAARYCDQSLQLSSSGRAILELHEAEITPEIFSTYPCYLFASTIVRLFKEGVSPEEASAYGPDLYSTTLQGNSFVNHPGGNDRGVIELHKSGVTGEMANAYKVPLSERDVPGSILRLHKAGITSEGLAKYPGFSVEDVISLHTIGADPSTAGLLLLSQTPQAVLYILGLKITPPEAKIAVDSRIKLEHFKLYLPAFAGRFSVDQIISFIRGGVLPEYISARSCDTFDSIMASFQALKA